MKNRTVVGIVCMILAVGLTFGISPLINRMADKKINVIRISQRIPEGTLITDNDIETAEVSKNSLPSGVITDEAEAIGKFAAADLFAGDYLTAEKLSDSNIRPENVLDDLPSGKCAISIRIGAFEAGLSGKLKNGDVISIYATSSDGVTNCPEELKYVKVITTTTSGGIDQEDVTADDDGSYTAASTITLLVSPSQAQILANYDQEYTIHAALVCRGDSENAQSLLDQQDNYLNGG